MMVEAAVPRRSNAMSLHHILCSTVANVAPVQQDIQERTSASASASLPHHDARECCVEFEGYTMLIAVYLNNFDEDEVEIIQLCLPSQVRSPVLGWTPPDGSEDVDISHEDLTCPSQMSISALRRIDRGASEPENYHITQLAYAKSTHPPAQPPRTRVVLAPTQVTASKTKRRAQSRVSCGYGQPPKGGIPPALARDVTKTHALRAEKERNRIRAAAAVARAGEGRKPSVLQKADS